MKIKHFIIGMIPLLIVWVPVIAKGKTIFADTLRKGTFILHKFQQPIGKEHYSVIVFGDSLQLNSDFKFNDRGRDVPLHTTLVSHKTGTPNYFVSKGKTSRFSTVDSEVRIINKDSASIRVDAKTELVKIAPQYFMINGYSPVAIQMQLVKYWKEKGKPSVLQIYPTGKLNIKFSGLDTAYINGSQLILERYFVGGLIWGNEMIWTDQVGHLIALFTNDAEGDKFEAIDEPYVSLLPSLIAKAAHYGILNFQLANENSSRSIALLNGTIVDVNSGNLIHKSVILIKDGIIQKIGKAEELRIPPNTQTIDVSGKTILPGLWDMHAHFQQVEWGPAYLAAGVTTIRDCGNEFDFINSVKNVIDNNNGIGPRIIKAGIIDSDGPMAIGIIHANSEEEARGAVHKYKDAGYEQIKLYSSVKPELIKIIADEAHKLGLTVTGHVPQNISAVEAIKRGQDQINHLQFVYRALVANKRGKLDTADSTAKNVLRLLVEKKVVIDPTLGVYEWDMRPTSQPLDAFEPGVNNITENLKVIFRNFGLPIDEAEKAKTYFENLKEVLLAVHRAGIPIVAGTDMLIPGYSIFRELELYNQAGLTPLEAIQTATIVPASVMKKDMELGSITEGKKADLIILEANPLENISNIRKIKTVIKNGKIYDPKALRVLVDFKP
jgi:imidazolonepropionase-like amidohydrolase